MGCGGSKSDTENSDNRRNNNRDIMEMSFALNEKTVEQFLNLQREINAYEKRHIPETLRVRQDQLHQLKKNLQRMESDFATIQRDIAREVPLRNKHNQSVDGSVRNFLMGQERYDELTAFEKADHLALLNKQEILRKEIEGTKIHIIELQQEVEILQEDLKDLEDLHSSEDKLLDSLFQGEYGSEKENYLENQLDCLELKLQKIEEANFKWRQAQVMIEFTCKQIGVAVEKWEEVIKTPVSNLETRYKLAEESRNNLIAAGQNIQGAHRYLPHIKFPYCTPEEVEMLNKATSYVFTDMQAKARQAHALDVYTAAHKRAGALLQWFNETINHDIKKNLMEVKTKAKSTSTDLRKERVDLIRRMVKEKYNKDIQVNVSDIDLDDDSEHDYGMDDENRNKSGNSVGMRGSYSDLSYSALPNAPSPIPLEELAPPPSKDELFGKIEEITKIHQQYIEKMNNDLMMSKARTQRDLNNKLHQRQMRRTRMRNHNEQQQFFQKQNNFESKQNGGHHLQRLPHQADDRFEDHDSDREVDMGRVVRQRY